MRTEGTTGLIVVLSEFGIEFTMSVQSFDYINYTNVTNALMMERYFDSDGSVTSMGANSPNGTTGRLQGVTESGVGSAV